MPSQLGPISKVYGDRTHMVFEKEQKRRGLLSPCPTSRQTLQNNLLSPPVALPPSQFWGYYGTVGASSGRFFHFFEELKARATCFFTSTWTGICSCTLVTSDRICATSSLRSSSRTLRAPAGVAFPSSSVS